MNYKKDKNFVRKKQKNFVVNVHRTLTQPYILQVYKIFLGEAELPPCKGTIFNWIGGQWKLKEYWITPQ